MQISFYVDKQASYPQTIPDTILKSEDPEKPCTTAMSYAKASELAKAQQQQQQDEQGQQEQGSGTEAAGAHRGRARSG